MASVGSLCQPRYLYSWLWDELPETRGRKRDAVYCTCSNAFYGRLSLQKILFSYIQSKIGPLFFIPKSWLPGHHNYKVSIDSLPESQQNEECPICFTAINLNIGETIEEQEALAEQANTPNQRNSNQQDNRISLVEKQQTMKHCYRTPCKHHFHKYCLTKWFDKKPDCPVCRKPLPYLE